MILISEIIVLNVKSQILSLSLIKMMKANCKYFNQVHDCKKTLLNCIFNFIIYIYLSIILSIISLKNIIYTKINNTYKMSEILQSKKSSRLNAKK